MQKSTFNTLLLHWYSENKRALPWRKTKNPYYIWLSEVILQQTQVAQGLPYYNRIVKRFPDVQSLANASQDEVLKEWEGLGYYSRARNMHVAAQQVAESDQGEFPKNYDDLLTLKGVGEYTAAAVSSIAYGEPRAVVDGNVFRVLSRLFSISTPINSTEGKKQFQELANQLIDETNPADYNQAIMEFGALQCKSKAPLCDTCPFMSQCLAYQSNAVGELPAKRRKQYKKHRHLNYAIFLNNQQVYIEQRQGKDVWQNLYQFYLLERPEETDLNDLIYELQEFVGHEHLDVKDEISLKKHQLSHQTLFIKLYIIHLNRPFQSVSKISGLWVNIHDLDSYPFPRPLRQFLELNVLTLPRE